MTYHDDLATRDLVAMVRELAREGLETISLLEAVSDVQWKRSEIPALPEEDDEKRRSKGGHGDPVPPVVFDGRRLALRAAVIAAEREVADATKRLSAARRHLIEAAERWQGLTRDDSRLGYTLSTSREEETGS